MSESVVGAGRILSRPRVVKRVSANCLDPTICTRCLYAFCVPATPCMLLLRMGILK